MAQQIVKFTEALRPFLSEAITQKHLKLFAKMSDEVWEIIKEKSKTVEELRSLQKGAIRIRVRADVNIEDLYSEKSFAGYNQKKRFLILLIILGLILIFG